VYSIGNGISNEKFKKNSCKVIAPSRNDLLKSVFSFFYPRVAIFFGKYATGMTSIYSPGPEDIGILWNWCQGEAVNPLDNGKFCVMPLKNLKVN
jgi:hypothetical protein